jgi:hypothetical protein
MQMSISRIDWDRSDKLLGMGNSLVVLGGERGRRKVGGRNSPEPPSFFCELAPYGAGWLPRNLCKKTIFCAAKCLAPTASTPTNRKKMGVWGNSFPGLPDP